MGDLLEVRLRIFVPCAVVGVPGLPLYYGGDNRGFQCHGGTSRADLQVLLRKGRDSGWNLHGEEVSFGEYDHYCLQALHRVNGNVRTVLQRETVYISRAGTSTAYNKADVAESGPPTWCYKVLQGRDPTKSATLQALRGHNWNVTRDSSNSRLMIWISAGNPLLLPELSPKIDANLSLDFGQEGYCSVTGEHDGFPAYEIYVNGQSVLAYNPADKGKTPWHLLVKSEKVAGRHKLEP